MNGYSYLTIRDYIFKNKHGIFEYTKCMMLFSDFESILKSVLNLLRNDDELNDINSIYQYMYDNNFNQVKNYNVDIVKDIIQQGLYIYNDKISDDNIRFVIKNRYINNSFNKFHTILLNDQYYNLKFNIFRNSNDLDIKDIAFNKNYDFDKFPIDITFRKKIDQNYQSIKNKNLSIYFDQYQISFVIGGEYYLLNIKDVIDFTYQVMNNLNSDNNDLKIKAELGYYYMLNNIYDIANLIINNYGKNQKIESVIKYNYENDIQNFDKIRYFYYLFDEMINYLAKSNKMTVKTYNLDKQILLYVQSFENKSLKKQNIQLDLTEINNGIESIYNYKKDKILPVVSNAAFNLQRHYNKDYDTLYDINFESHDVSRYIQFLTYKID